MFKVPNKYRLRNHPILGSDDSYGRNGFFQIPLEENVLANVQASDGMGWEHISVHIVENGEQQTPTWEEMCKIKDIFWDEDDCVVQYHPAKKDYVNQHEHVLHLWRPLTQRMPTPPPILVGLNRK